MGMIDVERQKRFDYILDHIKNGTFVSKEAANTFYVTKSTITKDLKDLALMYPQIRHNGKHGNGSKWNWVEDVESGDKYSARKTEEGYNDPTAAAVIKKIDNSIYGQFTPGDVWHVQTSNGSIEKYLVISSFVGCTTCLQIIDATKLPLNPIFHVPVSFVNKEVVDCRKIVSKPSRYFLEKDASYSVSNFDVIRRKIASLNKLDVTLEDDVKVKEKIVEKKVEVPVERIVEKVVEVPANSAETEMELALAKQKAGIYESLVWAFLTKLNGSEDDT